MRIVLLNWARVSEGTSSGGGVNGYAQQLGLELAKMGHEVIWLSSGWSYIPDPASGLPAPCKVIRKEDFQGIRVFEVLNSPVVAPGIFQQRDPMGELSAPALEQELTRFFHILEPDIVHFHNIEGFSAGCIAAARKPSDRWPGAKVIFSLHNYHTICPQVYLMKEGRHACTDFDAGHACEACIEGPDPEHERRERARFHFKPQPTIERAPLSERFAQLFVAPKPPPPPAIAWPGRQVESLADITPDPFKPAKAVTTEAPQAAPDYESPDWQPIPNEVRPEPQYGREPNSFGHRRRAMVDMLSTCDRVIAVSSFVRRKFEAMGVNPRVLTTLPIGSRMPDRCAATRDTSYDPPAFTRDNPRPIRAVFMGYHNYYKGLPMLLDSLELLTPEVLSRIQLSIYAKDIDVILPRIEHLAANLAGLTTRSGYRYDEVPQLCRAKDIGLVPSVWWDNGPQTVMEFFACGLPVLGAELGGIPDLVQHGHNGLLHKGNDRFDLARTLAAIVKDPAILTDLRRNVRPPLSMPVHAAAMESLYNECMGAGRE